MVIIVAKLFSDQFTAPFGGRSSRQAPAARATGGRDVCVGPQRPGSYAQQGQGKGERAVRALTNRERCPACAWGSASLAL